MLNHLMVHGCMPIYTAKKATMGMPAIGTGGLENLTRGLHSKLNGKKLSEHCFFGHDRISAVTGETGIVRF
jgi:hypothetical protein